MAWNIAGTYYAPCSCKVGCPCIFGELDGDQGWCSGTQAYEIRSGNVNGVDVSGVRMAWVADWPRGFLSGDGVGRVYWDPSVNQQQRDALAQLFTGKLGGVFEAIGALIPKFLPPKEAPISFSKGAEETRITVGEFGEFVVKPLKGPGGETRVLHGSAAFRDNIGLARGDGSYFRDPEMRPWTSAGHAEQTDFDWSA